MNRLQQLVGDTDIYLIDQILKNRFLPGDKILDAGCGEGRNLHWFIENNFEVYGVDANTDTITELKQRLPASLTENFQIALVEAIPFKDASFNHVISSAVLHFATSEAHFLQMVKEMARVLQPGGTLFIRMTSNVGIENRVQHIDKGIYLIPDGSTRFLLTPALLETILQHNNLALVEPFKTVNVSNERCMSTVVAQLVGQAL
jgi:tellurite methyltransferase